MKKLSIPTLLLALVCSAKLLQAAEMPKMPPPQKEHAWLQQLAGEWTSEGEMFMEPGKPPIKAKGSESSRSIGGFWILSEIKSSFMDMPFTGFMTLGYDPEKKKHVGTWVDSVNSYLWKYEGTVDAAGKTLTLDSEGPCPSAPGRLSKFKEVIELKSKDQKVFSSSMQADDGKWVTMMTIDYQRKK